MEESFLIGIVVVNIFCLVITCVIANNNNRNVAIAFIAGLFLGFIALIIYAAIGRAPESSQTQAYAANPYQNQLVAQARQDIMWNLTLPCSKCGNILRQGTLFCPKCGQKADWSVYNRKPQEEEEKS